MATGQILGIFGTTVGVYGQILSVQGFYQSPHNASVMSVQGFTLNGATLEITDINDIPKLEPGKTVTVTATCSTTPISVVWSEDSLYGVTITTPNPSFPLVIQYKTPILGNIEGAEVILRCSVVTSQGPAVATTQHSIYPHAWFWEKKVSGLVPVMVDGGPL